jgi:hypothetical protein
MALTTFNPRSFDLSDTYAFTGTVSGTNVGGGSLVKISEQTASASSSISFTSGIDSTYRTYVFKYISMHPATDSVDFQFNLSTDGGSNYNVTKTTSYFEAEHNEADTESGLSYITGSDLAQSTSYQSLTRYVSFDNDHAPSGELWLFNPSSTTYVKHFISNISNTNINNKLFNSYVAGYGNTTSAVNAINFKFSSGNIDDGTITMYGIA